MPLGDGGQARSDALPLSARPRRAECFPEKVDDSIDGLVGDPAQLHEAVQDCPPAPQRLVGGDTDVGRQAVLGAFNSDELAAGVAQILELSEHRGSFERPSLRASFFPQTWELVNSSDSGQQDQLRIGEGLGFSHKVVG